MFKWNPIENPDSPRSGSVHKATTVVLFWSRAWGSPEQVAQLCAGALDHAHDSFLQLCSRIIVPVLNFSPVEL